MTQNLSKPEPAPNPNGNPHLWSLVIRDMLDRNAAGVAKYGTALQAGNGRDALMDAYQEALDLCVYLRQAIEERRAMLHVARHGEVVDDELDPWQSAIPEQDVQRREQVATAGYIIPQMEDGDDDPIVRVVPDRTSRMTIPDECLGAMCGRVRG